MLLLGPDGVLHRHRKLMPTFQERLFHGFGDGRDLRVINTPLGRIGGLICWENRMPLARYAVYRGGPQIWIAPTADYGEAWVSLLRTIAVEAGAYAVGVRQHVTAADYPDDFPLPIEAGSPFPTAGAASPARTARWSPGRSSTRRGSWSPTAIWARSRPRSSGSTWSATTPARTFCCRCWRTATGSIRRMRVLITGGAGFIGSHLGDALLAKGHTVRALDNLDPQVHEGGERPSYLDPEIELQIGDVRDRDAVARAMDGVDTVVHFAAAVGVGQSMYAIERYTSINAMGAAIVLEEIAKRRDQLGRVLVASSMSIYGEGRYRCPLHGLVAPQVRSDEQLDRREWELVCDECGAPLEPLPTDETKPIWPMSIYAVGKRDHEEMFLAIGRAHRLPTVAMRFFNVYGDRQALSNPYTGVAAIFGGRLLNDNAPLVFEDGLQSRDFIHVSDIAAGCITALETGGADYRAVNLGTGVPTTVLDVARELARGLGKDIQPEIVNKFRAGDIRHCVSRHRARPRAARLRAEDRGSTTACGSCSGWVATQQATDTVDSASQELEAAGLTR